MAEKFLAKYFSSSKTAKLCNNIHFAQLETKSLHEACDRFKKLLCKYPHYDIKIWEQVHIFYNGIYLVTHPILDTTTRGTFIKKKAHETYELLKEMSSTNHNW